MPQPAPARFDASDRSAVVSFLLAATGPSLTLATLVGGYALSAHACAPYVRGSIAAAIGLSAALTLLSTLVLARRSKAAEPAASRTLRPAVLGIQLFCVLVMAAFGVAFATVVRCD